MQEVFTTADLLSPAREVDPFELPHETYAHLLVDEAQDVSPMQWRMLRRRGAQRQLDHRWRPCPELLDRH